VANPLAYLTAI